MGTETLDAANLLLRYAPYCVGGAGLCALLFAAVRYLIRADKEGRFGETIDRGTRVIGFLGAVCVIAGSGVVAVKDFVFQNPGQGAIENGASGSMLPSNDWWKPSGIGSNTGAGGMRPGGTDYAGGVLDDLRGDADEARRSGDEDTAENREWIANNLEKQNAMWEAFAKGMGLFNPALKPILSGGVDLIQNGNAANAANDAAHNANPHGPLVEEAKSMKWLG